MNKRTKHKRHSKRAQNRKMINKYGQKKFSKKVRSKLQDSGNDGTGSGKSKTFQEPLSGESLQGDNTTNGTPEYLFYLPINISVGNAFHPEIVPLGSICIMVTKDEIKDAVIRNPFVQKLTEKISEQWGEELVEEILSQLAQHEINRGNLISTIVSLLENAKFQAKFWRLARRIPWSFDSKDLFTFFLSPPFVPKSINFDTENIGIASFQNGKVSVVRILRGHDEFDPGIQKAFNFLLSRNPLDVSMRRYANLLFEYKKFRGGSSLVALAGAYESYLSSTTDDPELEKSIIFLFVANLFLMEVEPSSFPGFGDYENGLKKFSGLSQNEITLHLDKLKDENNG